MFNFEVKHGRNGAVTAFLDVDSGPDQMTYCACFDLYDWWAPVYFSAETMIYNPDVDPDELNLDPDVMPGNYSFISHTLHVNF
jgi:hypothetical protein